MDLKKHPAVHGQLDAAKDEVLERVNKALKDAGLLDFHVESIGLYYKQPAKKCGANEDLVFEPVSTGDEGTVIYGWVCKPRTK